MGKGQRMTEAVRSSLRGLRVVVDVQHLYRPNKPRDQGAVFVMPDGTRYTEANRTVIYAAALSLWLTSRGAQVLSNDAAHGILVGFYSERNRAAEHFGAHAYLACHLDAGHGNYCLMEHMTMTPGKTLAEAIGPRVVAAFPGVIEKASVRGLKSGERGAICIERVAPTIAAIICEPFFGDYQPHQPLLAATELARVGEAIGAGIGDWWASRARVAGVSTAAPGTPPSA